MRLKLKTITIIVTVSLVFVLIFQLYWLINLYKEQYHKMELAIVNSINNAGFKQVAMKVTNIITDFTEEVKGDSLESISIGMSGLTLNMNNDTNSALNESNDSSEYIIITDSKDNLSFSFEANFDFSDFFSSSGIFSSIIDSISFETNINSFHKFDSLLNKELEQLGINIPYYVEYSYTKEGIPVIIEIPEGLSDLEKSKYKEYSIDKLKDTEKPGFRLFLKNPKLYIFREMIGLILASIIMIILLIISYIYLLKIIMKQKTADEIKSDFINNITHELKTPISVAYAATDALQNFDMAKDEKKRDQYLSISKEQLINLNSLVEQILTMSVEERKSLRLHPENINLLNTFKTLKEHFLLNPIKEINIEIDVNPYNLYINADKTHFISIINNLIENAVKYSYDSVNIKLSAYIRNEKTVISVCDNGIGIPKDSFTKIYDRFYRVSKGNIHDVKGYGLGLFYVKTIVEKHGWSIEVKSNEGKGSCFNIYIL